MSNHLAIAAVTATLRTLLSSQIRNVTAQPPDRASQDAGVGDRINLFLYQTTPNSAWRNMDMPGQVKPGERGNPPLALNLSYLLTAYGPATPDADLTAHRLLGEALSMLHDHPVLRADDIRNATNDIADLRSSDLDQQVERVHINPIVPLTFEEMSKMWATFQTPYRLSATFQASVVLIESARSSLAAMPVLRRGKDDRGVLANTGVGPIISRIDYRADAQAPILPAAEPGRTVMILGQDLPTAGVSIVIRDPKREAVHGVADPDVVATLKPDANSTATSLSVTLKATNAVWPAGQLTLELQIPTPDRKVFSNTIPLLLAPRLKRNATQKPVVLIGDEDGRRILRLGLQDPLGDNRRVYLLLNPLQPGAVHQLVQERDLTGIGTFEPAFNISQVPPGDYWIRLRVDGVDSFLMEFVNNVPQNHFDDKLKIRIQP